MSHTVAHWYLTYFRKHSTASPLKRDAGRENMYKHVLWMEKNNRKRKKKKHRSASSTCQRDSTHTQDLCSLSAVRTHKSAALFPSRTINRWQMLNWAPKKKNKKKKTLSISSFQQNIRCFIYNLWIHLLCCFFFRFFFFFIFLLWRLVCVKQVDGSIRHGIRLTVSSDYGHERSEEIKSKPLHVVLSS